MEQPKQRRTNENPLKVPSCCCVVVVITFLVPLAVYPQLTVKGQRSSDQCPARKTQVETWGPGSHFCGFPFCPWLLCHDPPVDRYQQIPNKCKSHIYSMIPANCLMRNNNLGNKTVLLHHLVEAAGEGNGIWNDLLRVAMLDHSTQLSLAFVHEPLAGSVLSHQIFNC